MGLGNGRKKVLGLLTDSYNAVFVQEALSGIEGGLGNLPVRTELIELEELSEPEKNRRIERLALEKSVDGLLVCHLAFNGRQASLFSAAHIPVGLLAGRLEGVDWSMSDEIHGAYLATRHLLAMGHRRLALVGGPPVALESRLREDGFLRALKEEGLGPDRGSEVKILNFSENEGYEAGHLLMGLSQRPTAVFCAAGDITCLGLMTAFSEWGVRVPHDVSLVGYDGLAFSAHLDPPLTTVRQPLSEMARHLAARLAARMLDPGGRQPKGEIYESELVVRQSTAYPLEARVPA
jgi:DNA-binding LacI/PurR family transcriptional regulator